MAYQEQDGIPRSPGLHSLRFRLSDGRRLQGTTKTAGGCTRTGRRYPRNRRISEASLDRPKTWQRTKRRSAGDLLLLPRRASNLADYALRQGRSFRSYAERKASFEECQ